MTDKIQDAKFIPSFEEWGAYYARWSDKIAKSLWKFGSAHECREAVHEAFLKAMGISDHLHLRDELTPKVEGCWYGFLRNQARGILSNYHRFGGRFDSMKDYETENGDDEEPSSPEDVERADRANACEEVRQIIMSVCADAGVNDRNVRAFIRFVLDEEDGASVVEAIPELRNTNNLYQIRSRIMNLLIASADRFAETFDELVAA